ncbi:DUF6297 family protein [Actinoplanes sp. NBRC 103695]|uniref:DUF6297 family protein n=1 Tax=Actinoplanes sp. NBRC 103695 TaxID=3032202 RepID=UPI0024A3CD68|nr:DUF6297 family protein [Actinoplanes sp. NBRC 103695]GLY99715.1 hypothetical protein Acsp02_69680 [Actinoplanes sp. NBRC 103695]
MTTVAVAPLRRWIRRAQVAHLERGERFGTFYFVILFVLVVGSMFWNRLHALVWPADPDTSALAGAALITVVAGGLYLALGRLGPLAISRPAASWLLTAPISRRRLLWPSFATTTAFAALTSAVATLALLGRAGPRPVPVTLVLTGALVGVGVLLVTVAAQSGGRWAVLLDAVVSLLLAAGLAGLVVDAAVGAPRLSGWPPAATLVTATGAFALVAGLFFVLAVRGLTRTPDDRILDASRTAGTLADSAFGVEPSWVADMVERRYWTHRKLRSAALNSRLPVLAAQDLRLALRRPRRLLWLLLASALPALLTHAPVWLLGPAVLVGTLLAAGTTAGNTRTDAANPVLLRMLALNSRRAITQRLLIPAVLAAAWGALALTWLELLVALPPGPWWALGLALGPVGAIAAVRRARVGFVNNALLPIDTPMGSISTGPALASVIGYDALLLGLPAIVLIATGTPLTWLGVATQLAFGLLGGRAYLAGTTDPERVELAKPT